MSYDVILTNDRFPRPIPYVDHSFSHRYTPHIDESTKYKEDLLLSLVKLDKVKIQLSQYKKMDEQQRIAKKPDITEDVKKCLDHVIVVFNVNAARMDETCKNYLAKIDSKDYLGTSIYPSLETFAAQNRNITSRQELESKHYDTVLTAQVTDLARLSEITNVGQTALLYYEEVPRKMSEILKRAKSLGLEVKLSEQMSKTLSAHDLGRVVIFHAELREPKKAKPVSNVSTAASASSSSSNSSMLPTTKQPDSVALSSQPPASTTSTIIQAPITASNSITTEQKIEVSLSPQKPESTSYYSATVPFPKISGTLAVFHNPNWTEDKPLLFTPTDKGWVGPIPINRDYKFVILNGNEIEWENSPNRNVKMEDSLPPRLEVPKFSSLPNSETSFFVIDRTRWEESQPVVEEAIPQPAAEAPSTVSLTIPYSLEEGQTLGICHEPNWVEKPVLFTITHQGWQGKVPYGKDFKYVILMNGEVVRWENGGNRQVKRDSALPIATDSPNF